MRGGGSGLSTCLSCGRGVSDEARGRVGVGDSSCAESFKPKIKQHNEVVRTSLVPPKTRAPSDQRRPTRAKGGVIQPLDAFPSPLHDKRRKSSRRRRASSHCSTAVQQPLYSAPLEFRSRDEGRRRRIALGSPSLLGPPSAAELSNARNSP